MLDVDVDVDESDASAQLNGMQTPRETEHGGVALWESSVTRESLCLSAFNLRGGGVGWK